MAANHSQPEVSSGRQQQFKARAFAALQAQAAASQQPQQHPDLMAEAWHSTMQAQRATERLELLALSLHPDQQREAQQAVARMQAALRKCWDAFMQEEG